MFVTMSWNQQSSMALTFYTPTDFFLCLSSRAEGGCVMTESVSHDFQQLPYGHEGDENAGDLFFDRLIILRELIV